MMYRNTVQKQMVLEAVRSLQNHPTVEEVYGEISRCYPDISLATVYRNLNSLAENGLLLKIPLPNAAVRFDHTLAPHYHITCKSCGNFYDVTVPYLSEIDMSFSQITGFDIESHDIVFKGTCPNCN